MADCDVLVLGGGPNGLGAGALLQKQGLKTIVLEKNEMLGGLASASHFWPGVTHNTGAWGMFHDQLTWFWDMLGLSEKYGTELISAPAGSVNLGETPDDKPYRMSSNKADHDKMVLDDYGQQVLDDEVAMHEWFRPLSAGIDLILKNPPKSMSEMINMMPSPEAKLRMVNLFFGSAGDTIDRFHPDKSLRSLRGYLANLSTDGLWGGPYTPGSNLALAQHLIGHSTSTEVGGAYKIVKGTFGKMNEDIGMWIGDNGGTVKRNSEIDKIIVEKGNAKAVRLKNGEEITCKYLFSSLDPFNTFMRVMDEKDVPGWVRFGVSNINFRNHYLQAFVLLNGLPKYKGRLEFMNEGPIQWWTTRFSSPEVMENNWDHCKMGRRVPGDQITWNYLIGSLLDDTLAPKGQYSMTIYLPHTWPQGVPADKTAEVKESIFQEVIDSIENYAPNIREIMVDHRVYASPDYEAKFNSTKGSFCHGEIQPDQFWDLRPLPGLANWQVPFLPNMYLCGAGCHPGPGVSFLVPTNAVNRFLNDHKLK